jgi:flagellar hook-length control protein FliK
MSSAGVSEGAAMPTALSAHLAETPVSGSRPEAVARPVDAQPLDLRDHLDTAHEALSKRLGEALATRLLAQIEKGDWQIRLTVAPQHLGPIDIDLQVKGQRLEAQFQVAHGQTQALIQDSLPRLREAVSTSGMDLASVWVSGGWNERNRGNPTPGQPDDPVPLPLNEGGAEQAVGSAPTLDPRGSGGALRPGAVDILI